MMTIGIDPGRHGAIGYLFDDGRASVVDMPENPADLADELRQWILPMHAYVEQAQAMPRQGVSSTFQTGYGYGTIIGTLAALSIPYTTVTPAVWKRTLGLTGQDKEASRALARRQWPTAPLSLKKHEGRAEALLIAHYGRGKDGVR